MDRQYLKETDSIEIVIEQVRLEGGFKRGGRIKVEECLRINFFFFFFLRTGELSTTQKEGKENKSKDLIFYKIEAKFIS